MPRIPDPDDLFSAMDPYDNRDAQVWNNPEVRRASHGIPGDVYDETEEFLGRSPYDAFPMAESRMDSAEEAAIMQDQGTKDYNPYQGGMQPPGFGGPEFVSPNTSLGKYRGPSLGKDYETEIPTATSLPERPRTVAAGYDGERGVLTLMFRDGTLYNYYEVTPKTWATFKMLPSKWEFIAKTLDNHPRGNANLGSVNPKVLELMYQTSRTAQLLRHGKSIFPKKPKMHAPRATKARTTKVAHQPKRRRKKP